MGRYHCQSSPTPHITLRGHTLLSLAAHVQVTGKIHCFVFTRLDGQMGPLHCRWSTAIHHVSCVHLCSIFLQWHGLPVALPVVNSNASSVVRTFSCSGTASLSKRHYPGRIVWHQHCSGTYLSVTIRGHCFGGVFPVGWRQTVNLSSFLCLNPLVSAQQTQPY